MRSSGSRRGDPGLQAGEETPRHLPGNVSSTRYCVRMSRYRLLPSPIQEAVLRGHCAHARYVWNLAVEQHKHWHPGRASSPSYQEQCRQLTQARAGCAWLAAGSVTVQQQALRDFSQAIAAFFDPENPAGRPSWRKAGTGTKGSGSWGAARSGMCAACPAKWARCGCRRRGGCGSAGPAPCRRARSPTGSRWTGPGRWHVAFAVIPAPVPAPGNGQAVGIDRGVAVVRGPVHRRVAALPRPDRAGAGQAAAAAAHAGPREAGIEPPRPGQARDRPAAGPGE